jgi:lysophospholipase L1-like esterase
MKEHPIMTQSLTIKRGSVLLFIHLTRLTIAALILIAVVPPARSQQAGLPQDASWIGTWGVAPASETNDPSENGGLDFSQQTLRQVVHTSIGGTAARIHISNVYGSAPITVSDVHIARSNGGSDIITDTDQAVTFHGKTIVTVAKGAIAYSDEISFKVPALGDVAVSMYMPDTTPIANVTAHVFNESANYVADGDVSAQASLPGVVSIYQYYFFTGLDVQNASATGSVAAVGASITDGYASSFGTNHRWPNFLAQRLRAMGLQIGVLNEGLSGNKLLSDNDPLYGVSAEHRFTRDALKQPGVGWVIFSDDPINDLGDPDIPASRLIAGIESLIRRAHAQQLIFLCSTLTPYQGSGSWTQKGENTREAINTWIRGSDSGCDAVIDQDVATHDPKNPERYRPEYDSGDHLHPNDDGYRAIARAVPLAVFSQP